MGKYKITIDMTMTGDVSAPDKLREDIIRVLSENIDASEGTRFDISVVDVTDGRVE